jgi:hypothetical protein
MFANTFKYSFCSIGPALCLGRAVGYYVQCRHDGAGVESVHTTAVRKRPGAYCGTYVFVFLGSVIICQLYALTFSDQAKGTV